MTLLIPLPGDQLSSDIASLGRNQRLAMPYRNWAKMEAATKAEIRASAATFLDRLDAAPAGG